MVNQFRQLYVVKKLDDNNGYVVNKQVKSGNFSTLKSSLYISGKFAAEDDVTSENFSTGTHYTISGNTATVATSFASNTNYFELDNTNGTVIAFYALPNSATYVANTVYYTQNVSVTNEAGEINWNVSNAGDGVNKFIYFTYTGLGKDKNGRPSTSRSPLIDPKNIVSIKAVNPKSLNKNKLLQKTTIDFGAADVNFAGLPDKVILTINFTNFANGDSSIFPFTVSANKGANAAALVANLVTAINVDTKITDLSGNTLVVASDGSNGKLVITAQACGTYELGMQDVYYPKFSVTTDIYGNVYGGSDAALQIPQGTEFVVDTTANNGDVAAEMELVYMGERMQSGLPFNYPFNVNSKTMVNPNANYSCLDIHYYIDNDPDFSQRSHGTVTILFEESAVDSVTLINTVLGGISGTPAGSSANAGTLNKALATAGYSTLVQANVTA